jgi:hypothetical protein
MCIKNQFFKFFLLKGWLPFSCTKSSAKQSATSSGLIQVNQFNGEQKKDNGYIDYVKNIMEQRTLITIQ